MKFTTYRDRAGHHRWRLRAANGETVGASSEGFRSAIAAQTNAGLVCLGLEESRDKWRVIPEDSGE